jgi:hypothetical protein
VITQSQTKVKKPNPKYALAVNFNHISTIPSFIKQAL